uniref:Uncharacterized protein n=1 Tax=Anguilla anguilla TaxID=7936 RepID=A0A0E9QXH3_ANGAN
MDFSDQEVHTYVAKLTKYQMIKFIMLY